MFTISDKYKAFGTAVVGLLAVVASLYIEEQTLLAAVQGVIATVVVYQVANRPT